jgi:4-hydroxy-2-oxoheptanedioate aldolase
MRNVLRGLLASGSSALGTWITLADASVAEVAGIAGFGFVAIDLEHSAIGLETLQHHLRAAEAAGLGTLVRVPSPDAKFILRVLDAGAEGVLIPGVATAREADAAVRSCRYPPAGERGMSSLSRAARYGGHALGGVRRLADALNEAVVVALMIEEAAALEVVDAILATEGLDLAFIGPTDLSASLGLLGADDRTAVAAAVERVFDACAAARVPVGMPAGNSAYPRTASELRARGAKLLTIGTDLALLAGAFREAVDGAGS